MRLTLLLLSLFAASCSSPASRENTAGIRLVLPASLEPHRERLTLSIDSARSVLREFAAGYGWSELTKEEFMDSVMIFGDKALFDKTLLNLAGADSSTQLPPTYCAALESRVLIAMAPEYYAEVYPEGIEPGSYSKLLVHEMAHRLHIRILNGDEDAMGPTWFFEGFAIYAANQFSNSMLQLSSDELIDVLQAPERGSYVRYNYCFRYFVKSSNLKALIATASQPGFNDSLTQLIRKAQP